MWSNCLFFALTLWVRRRLLGGRPGFLRWRKSRLGSSVPHILYVERRTYGERVIHFVPENTELKKVPPPIFKGRSKWGDR